MLVKWSQGGTSTAQCWSKDMALWLGSLPKEEGFRVEAGTKNSSPVPEGTEFLNCLSS